MALQQVEAGAQAVQIFDTWGGNLSAAAYQEFSLAYMRKIVSGLIREHEGRKVPVILFTKNGGLRVESTLPQRYRPAYRCHAGLILSRSHPVQLRR